MCDRPTRANKSVGSIVSHWLNRRLESSTPCGDLSATRV